MSSKEVEEHWVEIVERFDELEDNCVSNVSIKFKGLVRESFNRLRTLLKKYNPSLGSDYIGFLHRHSAKPGFPEMRSHVVVDLEDWRIARSMLTEVKRDLECFDIQKDGLYSSKSGLINCTNCEYNNDLRCPVENETEEGVLIWSCHSKLKSKSSDLNPSRDLKDLKVKKKKITFDIISGEADAILEKLNGFIQHYDVTIESHIFDDKFKIYNTLIRKEERK